MYQGWKLIDKSISLKVWTTSQEVFSFFILSSQQTYLCFHCFPNFNLISVLIFHAIQTTEWNSQLEAWQRTYKFALQIKSLLAVMMFTCRIIVWLPLAPIFPTWWFWGWSSGHSVVFPRRQTVYFSLPLSDDDSAVSKMSPINKMTIYMSGQVKKS